MDNDIFVEFNGFRRIFDDIAEAIEYAFSLPATSEANIWLHY